MRIYKITADCLVDWCMLTWYVKARNEKEAWFKGWQIVRKSTVADEGSVDCERYTGAERVTLTEILVLEMVADELEERAEVAESFLNRESAFRGDAALIRGIIERGKNEAEESN